MKSTGFISLLVLAVLLGLLTMNTQIVEASYEDSAVEEAEIRFPFKEELEEIKSSELASIEDKREEEKNDIVEDIVIKTKAVVEKKSAPTVKEVVIEESVVEEKPVVFREVTSSIIDRNKMIADEEYVSEKNVTTVAEAVLEEEAEERITVENISIIDSADDVMANFTEDNSDEGEIVVEDISMVELSLMDFSDEGVEDLNSTIKDKEEVEMADQAIHDLYAASLVPHANAGVEEEKFAAFIKPFEELVQAESGDINAFIENVKIYDVTGKKVLEISDLNLGGSAFNLLPRGNYTIEVVSGNSFHTAILSKL